MIRAFFLEFLASHKNQAHHPRGSESDPILGASDFSRPSATVRVRKSPITLIVGREWTPGALGL